jgi:hypothetical protein
MVIYYFHKRFVSFFFNSFSFFCPSVLLVCQFIFVGGTDNPSLETDGIRVINAIKNIQLSNYVINLMVMDYDSSSPTPESCVVTGTGVNKRCDMSKSAIQAVLSLNSQFGIPFSKIAVTPMIGKNDVGDHEVFSLEDVKVLSQFVIENKLGGVHYWSLDRDKPCSSPLQTTVTEECHTYPIANSSLAFTNQFSTALTTDYSSRSPSIMPTISPTTVLSRLPTVTPSVSPSTSPTLSPSQSPTVSPSDSPSKSPTFSPSHTPTVTPSLTPSRSPTLSPSQSLTANTSISPSESPTLSPSRSPTITPSVSSSKSPTMSPSQTPTTPPSSIPTYHPSVTFSPSYSPTLNPTATPTSSFSPSYSPTLTPTATPTSSFSPPTANPTVGPVNSLSPSLSPLSAVVTTSSSLTSSSSSSSSLWIIGVAIAGFIVILAVLFFCLSYFQLLPFSNSSSTSSFDHNNANLSSSPSYDRLSAISASNFDDLGRIYPDHPDEIALTTFESRV